MTHPEPRRKPAAHETEAFRQIVEISRAPIQVRWHPRLRPRLRQIIAAAHRDARTVTAEERRILANVLGDWDSPRTPCLEKLIARAKERPTTLGGQEVRSLADILIGRLNRDYPDDFFPSEPGAEP